MISARIVRRVVLAGGTTNFQGVGEHMAKQPTASAPSMMNFKMLFLREKVLGVGMDLEGRVRSGPRASTVVAFFFSPFFFRVVTSRHVW